MIIKSFIDQCHNASTENLCRCYKNLRRKETVIQTKLECIRKELVQRGFLPPTDRLLKFFEETPNDKP